MQNRSILITGCSSGIGLASAQALKSRGWRVLATARKDEDLARLEQQEGLEALRLELREPRSIAACADEALRLTDGKLFALFNNAAYGQMGAVEDIPVNAMREQFEVNVIGTHDLTQRLIPAMRKEGRGRIVQCSSVLGLLSGPYRGAYSGTKFALEALSDALRAELNGSGVRISLIEPGPIWSKFIDNALAAFRANVDMSRSPTARSMNGGLKNWKQAGRRVSSWVRKRWLPNLFTRSKAGARKSATMSPPRPISPPPASASCQPR